MAVPSVLISPARLAAARAWSRPARSRRFGDIVSGGGSRVVRNSNDLQECRRARLEGLHLAPFQRPARLGNATSDVCKSFESRTCSEVPIVRVPLLHTTTPETSHTTIPDTLHTTTPETLHTTIPVTLLTTTPTPSRGTPRTSTSASSEAPGARSAAPPIGSTVSQRRRGGRAPFTPIRYLVLAQLREATAFGLSPGRLARLLAVRPSTLALHLDVLEAGEMISRSPRRLADMRKVAVRLTDRGVYALHRSSAHRRARAQR